MLVAVGKSVMQWLNLMRELKRKGLVDLIFPEFFDSKNDLIARRWIAYLRRLRKLENEVKVAAWPDYCYDARLRGKFSVEWLFPLHKASELDFALKVADYIGFLNCGWLRDYTLARYVEWKREYGFKAWLMGLKPRYLRALHLFDACDITTVSLPSYNFSEWRKLNQAEVWEEFLRQIKARRTTLDGWLG